MPGWLTELQAFRASQEGDTGMLYPDHPSVRKAHTLTAVALAVFVAWGLYSAVAHDDSYLVASVAWVFAYLGELLVEHHVATHLNEPSPLMARLPVIVVFGVVLGVLVWMSRGG